MLEIASQSSMPTGTGTTTTPGSNRVRQKKVHLKSVDSSGDKEILRAGSCLFRMGDRLNVIYLVNAGAIKVSRITECGDQQIIGFYMAGDLVGLDALPDGISKSEAVALDTASVTRISMNSLLTGHEKFNSQDLIRHMGVSLNRENDLAMTLSQRTADRRIAWFLVEFSDRLAGRGYSPSEFSLPMTRTDIALYLGLALETVCRELACFQESGLISKSRRQIKLLDIETLRHLATGEETLTSQSVRH